MYFVKDEVSSTCIIDKSRFISIITPIESLNDIDTTLKRLKKEYPKATHYCYAYSTGEGTGSNDDGEPSGTAGQPILSMIMKHQLTQVLITVIRYFGGIKLGAGGLIRAYQNSANDAIYLAKLYEKVPANIYEVIFKYEHQHIFDSTLKMLDLESKSYDNYVHYRYIITNDEALKSLETLKYLMIEMFLVDHKILHIDKN